MCAVNTSLNFNSLKTLLRNASAYYPIIIIYSICVSVLILATPVSVQSLVNTFSFGPYFQPLFILSLILLFLLTILAILKSLQYLLVEFMQRKLYSRLSAQIADAIENEKKSATSKTLKANRYFDVITIQKSLAYLITDGVTMALQTTIGLLLICFYHPYFIVFSILITVCALTPFILFRRSSMATSLKRSSSKYEVAEYIESLSGQEDMSEMRAVTDKKISGYLASRNLHFRQVFAQNILYVSLFAMLNAVLLGLGGYLVIVGQMTVGQLVATEIIVNAILSHFLYAQKYLESFYDLYAASEKVGVFLQRPADLVSSLSEYRSVASVYSPTNYRKIFLNFALALCAVLIILFVIPWQQTSRGLGDVTALSPNDRVQFITSTVSGRLEKWLVRDGQKVKKGDPIVRVVDNDPNFLLRLESNRDAALRKFDAAREASDTARLNFHRQEKLVKEGLTSPKEFEKAKITYKKLRSDEASAAASLTKAEVDFSRQKLQMIVAPRDGRILRVLHGSGSVNIKEGDKLVRFVPTASDPVVEIFLDGNDLPLITEGREVRLQFEGWPSVQFTGWPAVAIGSFGGLVTAIDPSVSSTGQFRILVSPDPNDPEDWPSEKYLRQGSRAIGLVLLDQVSIGYEIWRKVNGFPKSIDQNPRGKEKDKNKDDSKP